MKLLPRTALTAVVLLIATALFAGCAALKKPAPENPPGAQVPAPANPSQEPMPTNSEEVNRMAANLANKAARVPGVNGATVVITGTTAYVGIDEKAGLGGEDTAEVKRKVSNEIKQAEPRLTAVYVSSDPDIVARLRSIAGGVAAGKPVSAFDNELSEITKRISPTAR